MTTPAFQLFSCLNSVDSSQFQCLCIFAKCISTYFFLTEVTLFVSILYVKLSPTLHT